MSAEAERFTRTPWPVNSPRTLEIPLSPLQNSYQNPSFFSRARYVSVRGEERGMGWCVAVQRELAFPCKRRQRRGGGKTGGDGWMGGWVGGGVKR